MNTHANRAYGPSYYYVTKVRLALFNVKSFSRIRRIVERETDYSSCLDGIESTAEEIFEDIFEELRWY